MPLKIGDKAPAFSLASSEGRKIALADFKGRYLVLYFYLTDDTPGCTVQACDFRDLHSDFQNANVAVVGISPDDVDSHERFARKFKLPFPLLADPGHQVASRYSAWGEKLNYGKKYMGIIRSTFIIEPTGKIAHIFPNVRAKGHAQRVRKILATLRSP